MQKLESKKQAFLLLVKKKPNIALEDLHRFLDLYEDLHIEDFRGYVSEELYKELTNATPDITTEPNCTDIYFFGIPGSGKTSILMGFVGAHSYDYTINQESSLASSLRHYVDCGIMPDRTSDNNITAIQGKFNLESRCPFNLIEMPSEKLALHIANDQTISLDDMGASAAKLLRNGNRKVFFLLINPQEESAEHLNGYHISQLDFLRKLVSLFSLPENHDFMRNVDAIHLIVTKADLIGDRSSRNARAFEHLVNYKNLIQDLKSLCHHLNINFATNYSPIVFTFSLGEFSLGGDYDFDMQDTLNILEAIISRTRGKRKTSKTDTISNAIEKLGVRETLSHRKENKTRSEEERARREYEERIRMKEVEQTKHDAKQPPQEQIILPRPNKKGFWSRIFGKKCDDVYSSVFSPAETKRGAHLLIQVYLHLIEESEKVVSLAEETDKKTQRRGHIPLQCRLRKGDAVDIMMSI